jgi:hypothetical protein
MVKTLKKEMGKMLKVDGKPVLTEAGNYTIIATFLAGSKVNVSFDGTKMIVEQGGVTIKASARKYPGYFGGKVPSMRTLEGYVYDSICKSVTGKTCEPDGYGSDGSPSWLLALGMI